MSESHMVGILSGEWAVAYGFLDSGGKWVQRGRRRRRAREQHKGAYVRSRSTWSCLVPGELLSPCPYLTVASWLTRLGR